jgi:CBS-domain-containing membrane protein
MTPNAYMTDEAWKEAAVLLAKGIWSLPVVDDHPDWRFILALDGYGSHVNVYETLEVFVDHKIWLVKEEADTSSACQSYDQSVAKTDKRIVRPIIDTVRKKLGVISQWHLIAICLEGLKNVPKE